MVDLSKFKSFQWDKGNVDKSYEKHGITPNESEEAFLDEKAIILRDIKHSDKEKRFSLISKTASNKLLFVVFTIRRKQIRVISARRANKKERSAYAKATAG